jgi:hypothetical protein
MQAVESAKHDPGAGHAAANETARTRGETTLMPAGPTIQGQQPARLPCKEFA